MQGLPHSGGHGAVHHGSSNEREGCEGPYACVEASTSSEVNSNRRTRSDHQVLPELLASLCPSHVGSVDDVHLLVRRRLGSGAGSGGTARCALETSWRAPRVVLCGRDWIPFGCHAAQPTTSGAGHGTVYQGFSYTCKEIDAPQRLDGESLSSLVCSAEASTARFLK